MAHDLDLRIEHPADGWFPASVVGELEARMQDAFRVRGRKVLHDYFVKGSQYAPQNLLFFIIGRDKDDGGIGSGLITTREIIGEFLIDYYCKIFTTEKHSGNGAMKEMFQMARQYQSDGAVRPGLLRTSDPVASEIYAKYSEAPPLRINGFDVYGFGFYDKAIGRDMFEGAGDIFRKAATNVAYKARSVVPINAEETPPAIFVPQAYAA